VHEFLQKNEFPVPTVLKYDTEINAILLQDAGDIDLTSIADDFQYEDRLKESIDLLLKLQEQKPVTPISSKSFDYDKLNFEINYTYSAFERFNNTYQTEIDFSPPLLEFLDQAIKFLAKYSDKVICHRDFHARNILISKNGKLFWIDFQDMMMGLPQYDLASLLYDAYRPLKLEIRERLYNYFKENSIHKKNRFREYYLTQCLQRSFKALGTYLVMFHDKKNNKFKESIPKCLDNIMEISQLGGFPDSMYLFAFFLKKSLDEKEFNN
jgi:aminoglycoside/choline kinase family phosphotransferase